MAEDRFEVGSREVRGPKMGVLRLDKADFPHCQLLSFDIADAVAASTTPAARFRNVETNSSHVIMLSQPDLVIDVIRKAAAAVQKSQSK
jgi:hypothetical protein